MLFFSFFLPRNHSIHSIRLLIPLFLFLQITLGIQGATGVVYFDSVTITVVAVPSQSTSFIFFRYFLFLFIFFVSFRYLARKGSNSYLQILLHLLPSRLRYAREEEGVERDKLTSSFQAPTSGPVTLSVRNVYANSTLPIHPSPSISIYLHLYPSISIYIHLHPSPSISIYIHLHPSPSIPHHSSSLLITT